MAPVTESLVPPPAVSAPTRPATRFVPAPATPAPAASHTGGKNLDLRRARRRYRLYGLVLAATVLAGVGAVLTLNLLVDPYGIHPWTGLRRLAPYRRWDHRLARAGLLARGDADVLLLGSSRVEMSLDPAHPVWQDRRVYNLGLPGSSIHETARVFDYALRFGQPRLIVLGVDFFQFNETAADHSATRDTPFDPHFNSLRAACDELLGGTPTSLVVLYRARCDVPGVVTSAGHRPRLEIRHGCRAEFAQELEQWLGDPRFLGRFVPGDASRAALRHIVSTCASRGIALHLVINPVHALHLEAIRAAGLWDAFEQWKRDVAHIPAGAAGPVALRDFSGYHDFATEPVPPAGDRTGTLRWFWDTHHAKAALGDIVLSQALSNPAPPVRPGGGFGQLLTPENVESHLELIRTARARYAEAHAEEVRWVAEIAARCRPGNL